MRIAVLGNSPNWYFQQLQQAAGPESEVVFITWPELVARVGDQESIDTGKGCSNPFDAVLVRGMPLGSLEQVIFRMNLLARWQATGVLVVNSPRALEIAIDKYLSLAMIRQAGFRVPDLIVCQTVDAGMESFQELGGDVVVKPVFGGEGRGIVRVTEPEIALRSFRAIVNLQGVLYLQKFIDSGNRDVRLLVIGDQLLGMSRNNPGDWRTNATRGANCESLVPSAEQHEIAVAAARAVGTEIAGIDLIEDSIGNIFVLEVNGIPGWQAIQQVTGQNVADLAIQWIQKRLKSRK